GHAAAGEGQGAAVGLPIGLVRRGPGRLDSARVRAAQQREWGQRKASYDGVHLDQLHAVGGQAMKTEPTVTIPNIGPVARLWPGQGHRHQAYLALVGGLLRYGWPVERVEALVAALADATDDEEAAGRVRLVSDTAERLDRREPVTGWPRLAELLGAET